VDKIRPEIEAAIREACTPRHNLCVRTVTQSSSGGTESSETSQSSSSGSETSDTTQPDAGPPSSS
jgi:hypothetical protein